MFFRAVIFDLDGTLLDTLEDLAAAANRILAEAGLPGHPVKRYRYFVGDGLQVLIRRILPEHLREPYRIEQLAAAFKKDYGRSWRQATKPYAGIGTMLTNLQKSGISLNVLSNKPHDFTELCVSHFFPAWKFDQIIGLRPGAKRKPDPAGALEIADRLGMSPAEIAYLGDTDTDMMTARAAGMYPLGAAWGFRTVAELEESGARRVLVHPGELPSVITAMPD